MALTQQPSKWARLSPTIRVGYLGLFAAFLLVVSLALAPRAEAYIYWTTGTGAIGRANLDGSGVNRSLITSSEAQVTGEVAADARHIYWANWSPPPPPPELGGGPNSIGRANLDGTHVDDRFITKADAWGGLAVSTLPDTKLAGKATAATTQGESGEEIVVRVKLKANEQLTAKASGKVKVNPTYKLKPQQVKLATGETKTLNLRPKKAEAKKIAAALNRGEKAKVTVTLTDLAGNSETEKLRVRLKR